MPGLSLFLHSDLRTTEAIVHAHQEEFEILLKDLFTDEELEVLESKLDAIGAIYVQKKSDEVTFDDFYSEESRREFFDSCKSMITIENLPYLESNPFQVTYLKDLFAKFHDFLIDQGGVSELMNKSEFLNYLGKFKSLDGAPSIEKSNAPKPMKKSIPVDPIDFLILDVYKEFDRLKSTSVPFEELSEKVFSIYAVMRHERIEDGSELLKRVGLNAKDLDDGLERLKFWLRKF